MVNYFRIFWKTFAALAAGALLAVQGLDFATSNGLRDNGTALGLALLMALIGGLVAAGQAFVRSPASTPIQKAVRSGVQATVGVLGAVILNQSADLFDLPRVLLAGASSIVLAFFITLFQNQGTVSDSTGNVTAAP
jgi:hypothetical protein